MISVCNDSCHSPPPNKGLDCRSFVEKKQKEKKYHPAALEARCHGFCSQLSSDRAPRVTVTEYMRGSYNPRRETAAIVGSVTASNSSSMTPNAAYDGSLLVLTLVFVMPYFKEPHYEIAPECAL